MIQTSWTEISDDDAKEGADDTGACNYMGERGGGTHTNITFLLPKIVSIFPLN